jgi:asparagine synthase (glutamine-hydrolysing)
MCGIAGIITNTPAQLDESDLARLSTALAHRGPDGEGIWISSDGRTGFVHRRLAIIDTSVRGHQPMHSADGSFTIVFNGEIYNFLELRAELESLGSCFASDSDTEVILEAWRHWGSDMLPRFNGMWALAIRNNRTCEVFFARDRFGIKPLLYTMGEYGFAFASELRALLALPQTPRELDTETAKQMLIDPFSIEAGERTLVRTVRRLPAGHCATLRDGRLQIKRWWSTAENLLQVPTAPVEQSKRFRELFFDSIRIRLRSDVPIGTCLSGGFDSSAITCAIADITQNHAHEAREATSWRQAFIGSFPGQVNDETAVALEVAAYADVEPNVTIIADTDALQHITEVLHDLDDVYISLPTAPWRIYRELRLAKVVVSLDGHGADELMGAYRDGGQVFGFMLRNLFATLASRSPLRARAIESAKSTYLSLKGLNFVRGHRFLAPRGHGTPFDNDKLPPHWGALNRRLYRMFHASILPTILRNFDRMSMAHGIEVRMPFMDWRLVTYVMSLPDSAKADSQRSKLVARDAMVGKMPESIRTDTRKVGFNSPMPGWMNGPLAPWIDKLLSADDPAFSAMVDVPALRRKVKLLTVAQAWDWQSVGRLWPYIHLKWYIDEVINAPRKSQNHAR